MFAYFKDMIRNEVERFKTMSISCQQLAYTDVHNLSTYSKLTYLQDYPALARKNLIEMVDIT
jgi:hypothetical protein